jgi:hypothetical protein
MFTLLRFLFIPLLAVLTGLVGFVVDPRIWGTIYRWFMADPVGNTFLILTLLALWGVFVKGARFSYALLQSRRLVTLRVILPRSDSKVDQEQRTEKDWKERLAVMEQLFRALHEVKALTIWDILHFFIWRYNPMSFELFLTDNLIRFYVVTRPNLLSIIEKQITSFYKDAEVIPESGTPDIHPKGTRLVGYFQRLKKWYAYPLRFYEHMQEDPLNGLTNVLSKLEEGERATIQIVVTPILSQGWSHHAKALAEAGFKGKKLPIFGNIPGLKIIGWIFHEVFSAFGKGDETHAPGASRGDAFIRMIQPLEEMYKQIGQKAGMSGFETSIRILASAKTFRRALDITNNMQVAFNAYKSDYGNTLLNRRMFLPFMPLICNAPLIRFCWKHRLNGFLHRKDVLVERELASLFHFPDSRYNRVPNIEWIAYKVLPPPPDLPQEGTLIGRNRYRGVAKDVRIMRNDRTRHQYIIGKSGTGKSVLLSFMCRQDVQSGDGVCLVDPHGDLVEDVLCYVPKERAKDVILFDPADTERPMGLNLLEAHTDEEKDRASLDAMEIFIKMFGNEIFGPRIQHYFRNGCLTLMDDEEEGATLIDVPRLFVDEPFQKYKVAKCKNPVVRSFWEHEMAMTGAREKEEMIPYFSAKFGPFVTNTTIRNIIGQPKSAFNIREIMDHRKILLVNLSKGKIGDTNAQLLGLIFVNKVNMAAMSRADMPAEERKDFYLYVDEFQNFTTDAFATILSEARKYRLALIMAHQYIGQLVGKTAAYDQANTKLRDAVFGNVGTMLSFKIGAEDAEYMAKEYAPVLSEQDVIGIANYKCYVKLNINNTTSRPFSMETIWDETGKNDKLAELVRQYSRMKYGRKKVFVDQEIGDRIGLAS